MISRTVHLAAALVVASAIWLASTPAARADAPAASEGLAKATFAGGCFWCMQPAFDGLPGVASTRVGYTGGQKKDPTYHEVSAGGTGHAEAIEVTYDAKKVSYRKLLDVFWHNVDPTTPDRQFCDAGHQYRSAIFFQDAEQERDARASKAELDESKPFKEPIVTEIVPASTFYEAEEYHQEYYKKSPIRYAFYRRGCGRDKRLRDLWGAASGGH